MQNKLTFFRMLRIFKIFRIMRILKFLRKIKSNKAKDEINFKKPTISPLTHQILILVVSLLSTLFIAAGIIIFIDDETENAWTFNLNYIDAIYYVAVTGFTLGYGDIVPIREISRFTILITIVIIIYIFGTQIKDIVNIIRRGDYYDKKMRMKNHVVIFLFNDNLEILTSFLLYYLRYECIDENAETINEGAKILLICDREKGISNEIKNYMKLNIFDTRLKYIPSKRSVDKRLIDRGCLAHAREIYFLSDPKDQHSANLDKLSIIYAHFLKNHGVACEIYIQSSIECTDFRNWEENDSKNGSVNSFRDDASLAYSNMSTYAKISNTVEITCTEQLIMMSMARNLFSPGFMQFLSSLLLDSLESTQEDTFCAYVVDFPPSLIDYMFEEISFIYNKVNQTTNFKQRDLKFILLGIVNIDYDENEVIDLAPIGYRIK